MASLPDLERVACGKCFFFGGQTVCLDPADREDAGPVLKYVLPVIGMFSPEFTLGQYAKHSSVDKLSVRHDAQRCRGVSNSLANCEELCSLDCLAVAKQG